MSLYNYFWRNINDSFWQKTTFLLFGIMFALLLWSNIEAWYVPSCFTKETSDNINAVIENVACGYIVSYFTYVATSLMPILRRMRQHRVMLAENARRLYDCVSDFNEKLFQVGHEKENIQKPEFDDLYNNLCNQVTEFYQLKECNQKVITDYEQLIVQCQEVIEVGYEDLFEDERTLLQNLQLAKMWKIIEQLKMQKYLFSCEKWEQFANEICIYLNIVKTIKESLANNKSIKSSNRKIIKVLYIGMITKNLN